MLRDRTRAVSPLVPAEDAVVVDSTTMTADDVFAHVMFLVSQKGLVHSDG